MASERLALERLTSIIILQSHLDRHVLFRHRRFSLLLHLGEADGLALDLGALEEVSYVLGCRLEPVMADGLDLCIALLGALDLLD